MSKGLICIMIVASVMTLTCSSFAETIVLKSGKTIEGEIVERTEEYIKVEQYGIPLTYYLDEIESVEESSSYFSAENNLISVANRALTSHSGVRGAKELEIKARMVVQQGDYQKAVDYLNGAITLDPNYAGLHSNLGIVYLYLQQHDKAIASFEKAIELDPNYAEAYSNLGVIYKEKGEYDKSITTLEKAIELNPDYAELYLNIGTVYNWSRDFIKASEALEKAIKMKPSTLPEKPYSGMCFMHLGYAQLGIKKLDEAEKHLLKAKKIFRELNDASNFAYVTQLLESVKRYKNDDD